MLRPEVAMARKLRRAMSLPEVLLWQQIRGRKFGPKFRKQHPIGPYVADFYCAESRLVIEVDGEGHGRGDRPARDVARDAFLADNGYRVVRIRAADILRDMDAVITAIRALVAAPLHHPADGPPPRAGEDWGVLRRSAYPPRDGEGDRPAQPGGGGGVPRVMRGDVGPDIARVGENLSVPLPSAHPPRNADGVAAAIAALVANPLHHPADGPPPRAGEDWGVSLRSAHPPRDGEGDRPAQPGGGGGVPRVVRGDVGPDLGRHAITHAHGRGHTGPDPAANVPGEE